MGLTKTKDKIFYASAELFAEKTFANVSVREIAKKVGIQPASIYNHYESKDEILNELLNYYVQRKKQMFEEKQQKVEEPNHEITLDDAVFVYPQEEHQLMYWITRIVYMEQFNSHIAADILVGSGYQQSTQGYKHFIEHLENIGVIKNHQNCFYYIELLTRIAYSFELDFIHPEFEAQVDNLSDMLEFIYKLICANER